MLSVLNYITWDVSPFIYEGEHLVIFINPSDSTQWYISGDNALKTLGIVFVCIGAVFAAIFLIVLRGGKRIV